MSLDVPIPNSNSVGGEEQIKSPKNYRKEDRSITPTKRRGSTSKAMYGERSSTPMKRRGSVPKLHGDRSLTPNNRCSSKPTLKSFERSTVSSSARARCYPTGQTGLSASRTDHCSIRSPSSERLEETAIKRTRSVEPCVRLEACSVEAHDNLQRIDESGQVETIADTALKRSEALLAGLRSLDLMSTSPGDSPKVSPCASSHSMRRLGASLVDSSDGCNADSVVSKRRIPSDAYEDGSVVNSTMSTADSMTSFPCLEPSSPKTGASLSYSATACPEESQKRRHSLDSSFSIASSCCSLVAPVQATKTSDGDHKRRSIRRHTLASLPVFVHGASSTHTPPPSPRPSLYANSSIGLSPSSARSQQLLGLQKRSASKQQRPKTHVVRTTVKEVVREIVTVTDVYTISH